MSTKTAIPTWAQTWVLTAIAMMSNADAELKPLNPPSEGEREHVNKARVNLGTAMEFLRIAINESEELSRNGTKTAG